MREKLEELCECGHEYTFHDVLDNEACHLTYCPCKKFKPKNHCKYHTEFVNICAHCQEAQTKNHSPQNPSVPMVESPEDKPSDSVQKPASDLVETDGSNSEGTSNSKEKK